MESALFGEYGTILCAMNGTSEWCTEIGEESAVLNELKKIEYAREASLTYGAYDIVAKVQTETREKLEEVITEKIRRLNDVRSTLTMMVVEEG